MNSQGESSSFGVCLNDRGPTMAEYMWELPRWASDKFDRLMTELTELDLESDLAHAIMEEIRSLPGFPPYSERYSLIRRRITSETAFISH